MSITTERIFLSLIVSRKLSHTETFVLRFDLLIEKKKKDVKISSREMKEVVPSLLTKLEYYLYVMAPSREDYLDKSTLEERVKKLPISKLTMKITE